MSGGPANMASVPRIGTALQTTLLACPERQDSVDWQNAMARSRHIVGALDGRHDGCDMIHAY